MNLYDPFSYPVKTFGFRNVTLFPPIHHTQQSNQVCVYIYNEHKVCKLCKYLYGLKKALKQWHQKFDEVILSSSLNLNQSDKCVYSRFDSSGSGVIICLYVDDMLIFGTDQLQVDKMKMLLSSKFSIKDLGEADVILGIRIIRENNGLIMTQSHYVERILKRVLFYYI